MNICAKKVGWRFISGFCLISLIGCNESDVNAQSQRTVTPLQSCLSEVERDDRKCRLSSFANMSGFAQNPAVVAQCRQLKVQETEFCYRQFD
jgi:hypothetical protein